MITIKGINMNIRITENAFYTLEAGEALVYRTGGTTETEIPIRWPVFEIDGRMTGAPSDFHETGRRMCNEDIEEITLDKNDLSPSKVSDIDMGYIFVRSSGGSQSHIMRMLVNTICPGTLST